jgi:hypothetical protein
MCVLALGLMGCSETAGTGGSGGTAGVGGDPFPGNCGGQGLGGGAPIPEGGLYGTFWPDVVLPYRACAYVNEDCTELEASAKCNIGEDDSRAHFLEVEWTDGRTDTGDECAASVSVTTDLVNEIPIEEERDSFRIEFSDDEGAAWEISGYWSYEQLILAAARTTEDGVCRPHVDYLDPIWCIADSWDLCLENARHWVPPELVDFDFNPKQVDVTTAPANVVCEVTLAHPSGVHGVSCLFRSPSWQTHSCRADSPSSGDIYDGVWSCTVTIPQGEEPGLWYFRPIANFALTPSPSAWLEVVSR